ncbi:MAG TPA: F0F1 ATP synthase subunit A [Candidatus Paceibacterota bacterium]|nr:F0F1 ATP synthase subunit A [Candidatus Paceibacterota bacterium]
MHSGLEVVLAAERIGSVFGFPVTNALIMTWLVMAIIIVLAYFFGRSLSLVPGKLQAGAEWLYEGALAYMGETLESEELAKRFFPLIASIFIIVAVSNELEFFPGVGSFGLVHAEHFLPILRTPTTDLNFTLALAFISFLTIEITGIAALGFVKHFGRYVNFSSVVGFFVGLLEIISNLGRIITFSFRLFGNIFAGEIMVLVAGYFLPYFLPAPLMGFEMFIGLVQALVFAILTLFFIKLAIADPAEAH